MPTTSASSHGRPARAARRNTAATEVEATRGSPTEREPHRAAAAAGRGSCSSSSRPKLVVQRALPRQISITTVTPSPPGRTLAPRTTETGSPRGQVQSQRQEGPQQIPAPASISSARTIPRPNDQPEAQLGEPLGEAPTPRCRPGRTPMVPTVAMTIELHLGDGQRGQHLHPESKQQQHARASTSPAPSRPLTRPSQSPAATTRPASVTATATPAIRLPPGRAATPHHDHHHEDAQQHPDRLLRRVPSSPARRSRVATSTAGGPARRAAAGHQVAAHQAATRPVPPTPAPKISSRIAGSRPPPRPAARQTARLRLHARRQTTRA